MITRPEEDDLLHSLRSNDHMDRGKLAALGLRRTVYEFVLEYGWVYDAAQPPPGIGQGTLGHCTKNAYTLSVESDSLTYCEGFAIQRIGQDPTYHAWVTDGTGQAIDNTWPTLGIAYVGVPFKRLFVIMEGLKNHATVKLIDDYSRNWPLLGPLGNQTEEWLENVRGRGRIAAKDCITE